MVADPMLPLDVARRRPPRATDMRALKRAFEVADLELRVDPRRVGVRVASTLLPQHAFNRVRTMLLRAAGVRIGPKTCIAGPLRVTGRGSLAAMLSIGPGCYLTGPLHVDLMERVRIGARVYMGYDVALITADHEIGPSAQRCGPGVQGPIDVGDGAWVGSRAVVLPGVRIGGGAVVAAGAIVTRDVAPNTLVAGVPARVMRTLDPEADDEARPSDRRARLSTGDAQRNRLA